MKHKYDPLKEVRDQYYVPCVYLYETVNSVLHKHLKQTEIDHLKSILKGYEITLRFGQFTLVFDFDVAICQIMNLFLTLKKYSQEELFYAADVISNDLRSTKTEV